MSPSTCADYLRNVTLARSALLQLDRNTTKVTGIQGHGPVVIGVKDFVENIAEPIVCLFGILGNVLNLVVLMRRRLQRSGNQDARLERVSQLGLMTLAVSDLAFCVMYSLRWAIEERMVYEPTDNLTGLYFKIYQEFLINVFQLTSTWLTVNVALGRYLVVCYPLRARRYVSVRANRVVISLVFLLSVGVELPRFFHYQLDPQPCTVRVPQVPPPPRRAPDCPCFFYYKRVNALYQSMEFGYGVACCVVDTFVPLAILTFCNICLIRAKNRSKRLRDVVCRTPGRWRADENSVTATLIAVIVLFIVLAAPANLLVFVKMASKDWPPFAAATTATNFLLLCNFSVNFVLYCVLYDEFRRAAGQLVPCRRQSEVNRSRMNNGAAGTGLRRVKCIEVIASEFPDEETVC